MKKEGGTEAGKATLKLMLNKFMAEIIPLLPTTIETNELFEIDESERGLGKQYTLVNPETYQNLEGVAEALKSQAKDPVSGKTFRDSRNNHYSDAAVKASWNLAVKGTQIYDANILSKVATGIKALTGYDKTAMTAMGVLDNDYPVPQVIDDKTLRLALAYSELLHDIESNPDVLKLDTTGGGKIKDTALPHLAPMIELLDERIAQYVARQGERLKQQGDLEFPARFDADSIDEQVGSILGEIKSVTDRFSFETYGDLNSKVNHSESAASAKQIAIEIAEHLTTVADNKGAIAEIDALDKTAKEARFPTYNITYESAKDVAKFSGKTEAQNYSRKSAQKAIDASVKRATKTLQAPDVTYDNFLNLYATMAIPELNRQRLDELARQLKGLTTPDVVIPKLTGVDDIDELKNNIQSAEMQLYTVATVLENINKNIAQIEALRKELLQEQAKLQNNKSIHGRPINFADNPLLKSTCNEYYSQAIATVERELKQLTNEQTRLQQQRHLLKRGMDTAAKQIRQLESKGNIEKLKSFKAEIMAEIKTNKSKIENIQQANRVLANYTERSAPIEDRLQKLSENRKQGVKQFKALTQQSKGLKDAKNKVTSDDIADVDADQLAQDLSISEAEKAAITKLIESIKQPDQGLTWLSGYVITTARQTKIKTLQGKLDHRIAVIETELKTLQAGNQAMADEISSLEGQLENLNNEKQIRLSELGFDAGASTVGLLGQAKELQSDNKTLALKANNISLNIAKLKAEELERELQQIKTDVKQLNVAWDYSEDFMVQRDLLEQKQRQLSAFNARYASATKKMATLSEEFRAIIQSRNQINPTQIQSEDIAEFKSMHRQKLACNTALNAASSRIVTQQKDMKNHLAINLRKGIYELNFSDGTQGFKLMGKKPDFKNFITTEIEPALDSYTVSGNKRQLIASISKGQELFDSDPEITNVLNNVLQDLITIDQKIKAPTARELEAGSVKIEKDAGTTLRPSASQSSD